MCRFVYLLTLLISCANAISIFNDDANRILNGNSAVYNAFPYAISLQLNTVLQQETRGHRCGGVLITYQHVLTTASCLYDVGANNIPILINQVQYRVFAGASLLTNDTSTERVRGISNIIVHPDYIGPPSHLNDLAIITLVLPFGNTTVQPLRMPPATHSPKDFDVCTMVGWGGISTTSVASVELRYANKYVYNQQLCSFLLNSIGGSANVMPTMLCAASFDVLTSGCAGDSGNALVCDGVLTGILLYQQGGCLATAYPELYTRVNNYTTWVNSITGSASTFVPTVFTIIPFVIVQFLVTKIMH